MTKFPWPSSPRVKHVLIYVLWFVCCVAAWSQQSFCQSPQSVPFGLLPHGQPYTFQANVGASTVPVNVTPITASCSVFRKELDSITHEFGSTPWDLIKDVVLKTPIEETKLSCSCTGKEYTDINKCTTECIATLGCFVGICQPTDYLVCRTAVEMCEGFRIDHLNVAWWEPIDPADQKPECKTMASEVNSAILAHEEAHLTSMAQFQSSKRAYEMRVTSCDSTLAKVDAENKEKLKPLEDKCLEYFDDGYSTYPDNPDRPGANPFKSASSYMSCDACP